MNREEFERRIAAGDVPDASHATLAAVDRLTVALVDLFEQHLPDCSDPATVLTAASTAVGGLIGTIWHARSADTAREKACETFAAMVAISAQNCAMFHQSRRENRE